MYIKFLIGSILFAGICFGVGYRVCWLRMGKQCKELEARYRRLDEDYDLLLKRYKRQVAYVRHALGELRSATPSCGMVRNDSGGERIATPVYAPARNDSEGAADGNGAFAEHIERRFKGEV